MIVAPPVRLRRLASFMVGRVDVLRSRSDELAPARLFPWWLVALALGLSLRLYHYLRNPPVWHDEAAQIQNALQKDFTQFLGPLYYSEACPPLFLAAEKLIALTLGSSTYALRLLPFLASCASLVLLVFLAKRLVPRAGATGFAFLIAFSERLLWHTCEAKPYALDMLVATGVLWLMLREPGKQRGEGAESRRLLLALTLLSPLLIFLSFPACFLLGGAALTLLPHMWRQRSYVNWVCYGAFGAVLVGAFLALYATAVRAQRDHAIVSIWAANFPDWHNPWRVPGMLLMRLTEVFRYAAEPSGNVLVVLAIIGAIAWWREGHKRLLAVLVWPVALNVAAWLHGSYPLGATRIMMYAVPAVLLLVAAGITPAWAFLSRWGFRGRLALVGLLLVPMGCGVYVLFRPCARLDSATPTAFVLAHRGPEEAVVGTLWEQAYYCRGLGNQYRALVPAPPDPPSLPSAIALGPDGTPTEQTVCRLWLLGGHDPLAQQEYLQQLKPAGRWRILATYRFHDVTVLHVERSGCRRQP